MELFNKKFVHFMWDDKLKGKKCFLADGIDVLKAFVREGRTDLQHEVKESDDTNRPFQSNINGIKFVFAYFDPNYEIEKAFNEGKKIQFKSEDGKWCNLDDECMLKWYIDASCQLRVNPEGEKKWIVYLDRLHDYLTACLEDTWKSAQKQYHAKTKLFVGTESEVNEWFESRQKLAKVIKAWEDGKQIQFLNYGQWEDCRGKPLWSLTNVYHVKPEGKEYRPYKSGKEFIQDFQERFRIKYNPSWSMPSIWVKNKENDARFLIFAFYERFIKFNDDEPLMFKELLEQYVYLDGSPCGMEVKE